MMKNKNLKSPLCEYVESKNICRYNETYNKKLLDVINRKPPWGIYNAKNWDNDTNKLINSSKINNGTPKDAVTSGNIYKKVSSGNGALHPIPYITGDINSSIIWPQGSIGEKFTLCSITRHSGMSGNVIILGLENNNSWFHGHWEKKGMALYGDRNNKENNKWKAMNENNKVKGKQNDWLVMCGKNGSHNENMFYEKVENSVLGNSIPIGLNFDGYGNGRLCINKNSYTNCSWALSYVIIWDQILTDEEMMTVSESLKHYLLTGEGL